MIDKLFIIYTRLLLTFFIFFTTYGDLLCQKNDYEKIIIGETSAIYSEILGEERSYLVYLPPSYKDSTLTEKYPVVYLLDGSWYFHPTTGIIEYAKGAFKMPEMIVIGIVNTDRIRDFTPTTSNQNMFGDTIKGLENSGGGDLIINFLKDELMSHIDATYRTVDYRILVGHSFGGLLASHILVKENALFNAYIIIDPSLWWDNLRHVNEVEKFLTENPQLTNTMYLGEADNNSMGTTDNTPHVHAIKKYKDLFSSKKRDNIRYKYDFFKGETHASVGLPSVYYGLSFIFNGYRPPDTTFHHIELLVAHYHSLAKNYGFEILPPEGLVRNLGWGAQYGEKNLSKAIPFFELNIKNYPNSANAFKVLAEAYEMDNNKTEALIYYQKYLQLNPGDKTIKMKIDDMLGK